MCSRDWNSTTAKPEPATRSYSAKTCPLKRNHKNIKSIVLYISLNKHAKAYEFKMSNKGLWHPLKSLGNNKTIRGQDTSGPNRFYKFDSGKTTMQQE